MTEQTDYRRPPATFIEDLLPDTHDGLPLVPSGSYQLASTATPDAYVSAPAHQRDTNSIPRDPARPSGFDFASTALRTLSAFAGGSALTWLATLAPSALPSADTLSFVTHYSTLAVLLYGLLRVYRKGRDPEKYSLKETDLDPLSRFVLRHAGRHAWILFHLTQPFWAMLAAGLVFAAGLLGISLLGSAWDWAAPVPHPPGHFPRDSFASLFFVRLVNLAQAAFFGIGLLCLPFALCSAIQGRRSTGRVMFAAACLSAALMLYMLGAAAGPELNPGTFDDPGAYLGR